jgi:uncharacterized protein (DUF1810 family)
MNLNRFIKAQETKYGAALSEIKSGKKVSHWMWYIFPQIQGVGHSPMAITYAIKDIDEAKAYLIHPILGQRLIEISEAFYQLSGKTAHDVLGFPDDLKLKSCMTLFALAQEEDESIFRRVLKKFYGEDVCLKTLEILNVQSIIL